MESHVELKITLERKKSLKDLHSCRRKTFQGLVLAQAGIVERSVELVGCRVMHETHQSVSVVLNNTRLVLRCLVLQGLLQSSPVRCAIGRAILLNLRLAIFGHEFNIDVFDVKTLEQVKEVVCVVEVVVDYNLVSMTSTARI
jgi:hypothetical protein